MAAGDAYWCASGLPGTVQSDDKHSMIRLMGMAIEIQEVLRDKSLPCFSVPAIKTEVGESKLDLSAILRRAGSPAMCLTAMLFLCAGPPRGGAGGNTLW